ncbi:phage tail tape measure protein, partial [Clostridium perfringens]
MLNSYGLEASEVARISDVLIQSQNLGKLTLEQLSSSMGRVIPTAKAAGVGIEQVSSAYVEMTKAGVSVEESTTYVN